MTIELAGRNPHRQEDTSRMQPADETFTHFDMRKGGRILLDRLDERLKALGLSDNAASEKTGLGRDLIRDLRRNPSRSPLLDTTIALARVLECSLDYLIDPKVVNFTAKEVHQVRAADTLKITGLVGTDLWQNPMRLEDQHMGYVKAMINPTVGEQQTYALRVVGDAMNRSAPDGSVAIINTDEGRTPRDREMVVVLRRQNGLVERSLRRVIRTSEGYELHPESTDPTFETLKYDPAGTPIIGYVDWICIKPD